MSNPIISGIQQVGIGCLDVDASFKWYRQHFGIDVPIFEDEGATNLMLSYTGGTFRGRRVILAVNMKGGGGVEILQNTTRSPRPASFTIHLGDIGHFVTRMKSDDVKLSYEFLKKDLGNHSTKLENNAINKGSVLGGLTSSPDGQENFFVCDPWGNIFEIVPGMDWFEKGTRHMGGPAGALLGVTDIERSQRFYADILGYDTLIYDQTGTFDDFHNLPGGDIRVRRVLLKHSQPRAGAFSRLFGSSMIELVQALGKAPRKIFEGRWWGDLGFIHLCFEVVGMEEMKARCESRGYPFLIDSADSIDIGGASGRFSYIEDPDGTPIEFVETHKIPLVKGIGWYLNLKHRRTGKPLPDWMLKALKLKRVRD